MFNRYQEFSRVLLLCLGFAWIPVQASEFDGTWRTQGYGAVVEISGNTVTIYDETSISFFPVEEVQLQGNRVNLGLPPNEEIYELRIEGDSLVAEHRTSKLFLDRLDHLPAIRGTSPDPLNVFDVFWSNIHENFASFSLLNLDWQQIRQEFRGQISNSTNPNTLFNLLGDMGARLLDGHTTLHAPDLNRFRNTGPAPSLLGGALADDVLENVESEFIDGGRFSEIPLDDRFVYGTINQGAVGFLAILDYEYRVVSFDQSLDAALDALSDTEALIIDLRDNDGGDNWNAMAVTDRITDRERQVLTRVVRTGGPDDFGAAKQYFTKPAGQRYTDRPVYLLTNDGTASAGDVQSLMLSALPAVTQVGEPTRGMFSKFTRGLPNGWIMSTSNERFLSLDGINYEYQGIRPEIEVENTVAALNQGKDLILEAALEDFSLRLPIENSSRPVTAAMSGSWFAPDHDGEGFLLEVLDDERALVYWFSYAPDSGKQAWMIAVGDIEGDTIRFADTLQPVGARFGDAFSPEDVLEKPWGEMAIRFTSCNRAVVSYQGPDIYGANHQSVQRLSGHDGLDCNGPVAGAPNGISGSWFNASRSGEGWILSRLPGSRAVMFWFTYDNHGEQMWLIGVGETDGTSAGFTDVLRPRGGRFGPGFDPNDVELEHWGSLQFSFSGCDNGSVAWTPVSGEFSAGERQVTRLTSLSGLDCP